MYWLFNFFILLSTSLDLSSIFYLLPLYIIFIIYCFLSIIFIYSYFHNFYLYLFNLSWCLENFTYYLIFNLNQCIYFCYWISLDLLTSIWIHWSNHYLREGSGLIDLLSFIILLAFTQRFVYRLSPILSYPLSSVSYEITSDCIRYPGSF